MTIVKKLKLVGYPYKIFKNTCFVQVGGPAECLPAVCQRSIVVAGVKAVLKMQPPHL